MGQIDIFPKEIEIARQRERYLKELARVILKAW